jgi:hypothetical protein
MALSRSVNVKRLVLLLWVLVAFFYFYLSYDYIRITMSDREFAEYLQHVVQVSGIEQRTAKDVRDLLLIRAAQLSLPVSRDQIVVRGGGNSLDVVVNYAVDIELPLLRREVYTKRFEHNAKYQGPR